MQLILYISTSYKGLVVLRWILVGDWYTAYNALNNRNLFLTYKRMRHLLRYM